MPKNQNAPAIAAARGIPTPRPTPRPMPRELVEVLLPPGEDAVVLNDDEVVVVVAPASVGVLLVAVAEDVVDSRLPPPPVPVLVAGLSGIVASTLGTLVPRRKMSLVVLQQAKLPTYGPGSQQ